MTGNQLARIGHADDFNARLEQKKNELAAEVQGAGRSFTSGMAEMVAMLNAEVLRLQGVLRDNTAIPERHPVSMTVSSVGQLDGKIIRHVLVATANDGSSWLMENFHPNGRPEHFQWARIPRLPSAAEEAGLE